MNSLRTCTLYNSETLEPLTWSRVCPSFCYEHTFERYHVLYLPYLTSVNLQQSNCLLAFVILYIILAPFLTLIFEIIEVKVLVVKLLTVEVLDKPRDFSRIPKKRKNIENDRSSHLTTDLKVEPTFYTHLHTHTHTHMHTHSHTHARSHKQALTKTLFLTLTRTYTRTKTHPKTFKL